MSLRIDIKLHRDFTWSVILSVTSILGNISYHRAILMLENQEIRIKDVLRQSINIIYTRSIIYLSVVFINILASIINHVKSLIRFVSNVWVPKRKSSNNSQRDRSSVVALAAFNQQVRWIYPSSRFSLAGIDSKCVRTKCFAVFSCKLSICSSLR